MKRNIFQVVVGILFLAGGQVFAQTDAGAMMPEKPDANGWVTLFDGTTLSGWTAPDPGNWAIGQYRMAW